MVNIGYLHHCDLYSPLVHRCHSIPCYAHPLGRQTAVAEATEVRVTAADCTAAKVGMSIEPSAIGEPVKVVTLAEPSWVEATNNVPAHCRVNGSMAPVDTAPTSRAINFSVVLPASWG